MGIASKLIKFKLLKKGYDYYKEYKRKNKSSNLNRPRTT